MAFFGKSLAKHLSSVLECDLEKVIKALDSWTGVGSSDVNTTGTTFTRKPLTQTKKKEASSEEHLCERMKRGKDEICGKNAKRSLERDGIVRWYCGGEKSGCFAIENKAVAKKILTDDGVTKTSTRKQTASTRPTTNTERKERADLSSKSLLTKIMGSAKKINAVSIETPSHGKIYYDKNTRVLFDNQTQEAYGILDKDNDTILPIDDDNLRWIEASNFSVRRDVPAKTEKPPEEEVNDEIELDDEELEEDDEFEEEEDDE